MYSLRKTTLFAALLLLLSASSGLAVSGDDITAVAAKSSPDYVRIRRADGTFEPETYAFGDGGKKEGGIRDISIDSPTFLDIAKVIAGPLGKQGYIPSRDPSKTKLLIMVYWGLTDVPPPISSSQAYANMSAAQNALSQATGAPSVAATAKGAPGVSTGASAASSASDAQLAQMSAATAMLNMENHQRDQIDFANAQMLGYDSEGVIGTEYGKNQRGLARGIRVETLVDEIEQNRYFVVLMAYDFQLMWKEKKHKLLWETRFSMTQRHHQFDRDLAAMSKYASQYFGQNTSGLVRDPFPEGKVSIGDVKSLGDEPEK